MDRPPGLIPLLDCAGQPAGAVGRKAQVLGWADAQGLSTPGGLVLPAEQFWAAVSACGATGKVKYLEQAALRLDPSHALAIAADIVAAMDASVLESLAAGDAAEAFARLGADRVVCRSSSAMEDGRAAAFPGVFTSVLDIASAPALACAIATCWRSAFSAAALRYLLRVAAEPVDFSLALLLQRQVEGAWFGIYASVDPLTGAPEPLADLSAVAPDALVNGAAAQIRARRVDGRWAGAGDLATSLDAVHAAASRLAAHLDTPVDVEFALPVAGADPVLLQCRPLRPAAGPAGPPAGSADAPLLGRPCAGGRASGMASAAGAGGILLVERLTPANYDLVLAATGVVMEDDASPLSHVAILCREVGVPFVCGVEGARARLEGRRVAIDGAAGQVEILDADAAPAPAPPVSRLRPAPAISTVEVLLRLLAEGRPGHDPAGEAARVLHRYGRALGGAGVRVVAHPVGAEELARLQRLGAGLFGPAFSAASLLAHLAGDVSSDHVPQHHPAPRPGTAGDG